jgi:hypothetical protein
MPTIDLKPIKLIYYADGRKGKSDKRTFWLNIDVVESFAEVVAKWEEQGGRFWVTECLRTIETQRRLKAKKPTLAQAPGWSLHGHGRAVDFDVRSIGGEKELLRFYEHLAKWGWYTIYNSPGKPLVYRPREAWHVQRTDPPGLSAKEYLTRWAKAHGGLDALLKISYHKISS